MPEGERREKCRIPGCNKWHKLQVYLDHNLDERLQTVLNQSQYSSLRPLVYHILRSYLNEVGDSLDAIITPPKKRIRVSISELRDASVLELREFARSLEITYTRRKDIMEMLEAHSGVLIVRDAA